MLIEAEKTRHVYLFEYGQKPSRRNFRKTYWLATVFASQLVTLLVVWIALVWIADFSRQV